MERMEKTQKQHRKVEVTASGSYPVWIGSQLLSSVGEIIRRAKKNSCRAALITDYITGGLFENKVERSLKQAGFTVVKMTVPPGESSKSMEQLERVLSFLTESRLDRSDLVVALGGGVVGDLAGFAAAVYLRGVNYIQIPTTFLAAIDSSVGGKTAVNLAGGKNLAGAFHQPTAVICDCDAFRTLPQTVFSDGVAEAVKYGVLAGGKLFQQIRGGKGGKPGLPEEQLAEIVEECVSIKGDIVKKDEFDRDERQLLNLGHTIGHGVERCSNYRITHGSAVAVGMAVMARAAYRAGLAERGCWEEIEAALRVQGLPTETDFSAEDLFQAAMADKKRTGDTIQIIIPQAIGRCVTRRVPEKELKRLIKLGLPSLEPAGREVVTGGAAR